MTLRQRSEEPKRQRSEEPNMTPTREEVSSNLRMGGNIWIRPKRLLIVAAIFHVAVTITTYTLGRYAVLPANFDSNGIAISFAPDAAIDRADAVKLSEMLRSSFRDWLTAPFAFHTKLYSLCFALFGTTLGTNILSAEPINLLFYLATLLLVFQLGRQAFDARAGILASVIVGLWPSLLLHSTQMLKDPLFLVSKLAFVLISMYLLSRNLSWLPATLLALLGGLVAIFVWLGRDSMVQMLVATSLLGVTLLVVRQVREKQLRAANLFALTLLTLISISVTLLLPRFMKTDGPKTATTNVGIGDELSSNTGTENSTAQSAQTKQGPVARVSVLRKRFIEMYPNSTSNVDTHIQLTGMADILRYTPRAAAIGFFAPFPNMWLTSGKQVGSAGRLVSGIETLAMYALEVLAIIGLWHERRQFSVWLLVSTATIGVIALGMIVVNVGALYRLRYAFLILIIIVAAGGISQLLDRYHSQAHSSLQTRSNL